MAVHRRPEIRFTDAPRATCRWCGEPIVHRSGPKRGQPDRRRRWHPECVDAYNATDPRELRRRIRRRDRGRCAVCALDTYALKRRMKGRGMWSKLCAMGFVRRRSLWELDHIVPLIDSGSHELSNLQTLCVPCHREKTARESRDRAVRRSGEPGSSRPRKRPDAVSESEFSRLLAEVDEVNARIAEALDRRSGRPQRVPVRSANAE